MMNFHRYNLHHHRKLIKYQEFFFLKIGVVAELKMVKFEWRDLLRWWQDFCCYYLDFYHIWFEHQEFLVLKIEVVAEFDFVKFDWWDLLH